MEKKFYTCKEVAERYGVKETTVWEWIRTGKLDAMTFGSGRPIYRVPADALEAFETRAKNFRESI
jgi:excisionase family DNA binding protein